MGLVDDYLINIPNGTMEQMKRARGARECKKKRKKIRNVLG